MRSVRMSFRSLALTCVATAAVVVACSSSSEGPNAMSITKMRLLIGGGANRLPYVMRPGDSANNIAILSNIGQLAANDTQVVVAWLREDNTVDKDLKPAFGWRAVIAESLDVRPQGLDIRGHVYDAYGFTIKSGSQGVSTFTGAALPAAGIPVNFFLLDPSGNRVFGPIIVTFKTP